MSAATPPTPPTGGVARRTVNGGTTVNGHAGTVSSPGARANSGMGGGQPGGRKPFRHFNDLVLEANTNLDIHAPMRTLLQLADQSARKAETDLGFGRLDLAYVAYLIATDLVANHVPRHKDYPELHMGRGQLWRLHMDLQKRVNLRHDAFKEVGERIREDNLRSGVRPRSADLGNVVPSVPASNAAPARSPSLPYDNTALKIPDGPVQDHAVIPPPAPSSSGKPAQPRPGDANASPKRKPVVQPKPQGLQSRHINSRAPMKISLEGVSSPDALADRFARLRSPGGSPANMPPISQASGAARASIGGPDPTTQAALLPLSQTSSAPNIPPPLDRPSGPREIPPTLSGPSRPPKLPINTILSSMPKQPSPTYSPARYSAGVGDMDLPSAEAITNGTHDSTGPHRPSISSQASVPPHSQPGHSFVDSRKPSIDLPHQSMITADELYKYLRQGSDKLSILIIDVRTRPDFDDGHIFAQSVMCIEPLALRPGMSAEDIEERLVLSPEFEQSLFIRRNRFDLVVYHDRSSTSIKASGYSRPSLDKVALATLDQALGNFSYGKPLQRPPALLVGGIDAWVDLVGSHALKATTSGNGDGRGAAASSRLGRPLSRVPKARSTQRLQESRKSRAPTDKDEEADTVNGSEASEAPPAYEDSISAAGDEQASTMTNGSRPFSYSHDYEDFLHRFPEVSDMKESMSSPTSRGRSSSVLDDKFHGFSRVHQSPTSDTPGSPGSISRPPLAVPRPSFKGHSEKSYYPPIPDRPPPIAPSHGAPPSSFPQYMDIKVGQTGLQNFGATCYMSAVIQCLSGTTPLTRFFMDGSFRNAVQRHNPLGTRGKLPEIYANTMRHLWDGNSTYIVPRSLRDFVAHDNHEFYDPCTQHDANDFFVYILDRMHEDLNYNFNRTPLKSLSTADERKRESMPSSVVSRIEFNRYSHRNLSWISKLFDGQHSSRLQCPACSCSSTSYETFKAVSLEIPRNATHIYQCLDNYTKREILTGDDRWLCPDCKVPREATKKITFTRAPPILVVQLKRFQTVRRGLTNKNTSFVRFPLVELDLTPYMLPPLTPEARQDALAKYGDAVLEPEEQTTPPFRYDAYAVVQHMGSLSGGHYTALVCTDMQRGTWMEFNDKHVQPIAPERVVSEKAYLVFYVRSNTQAEG